MMKLVKKVLTLTLVICICMQIGQVLRSGFSELCLINPITMAEAGLMSNPAQIYVIEFLLSMIMCLFSHRRLNSIVVPGIFAIGMPYISMMAWCTGGQQEYKSNGTTLVILGGIVLCIYFAYCFKMPARK